MRDRPVLHLLCCRGVENYWLLKQIESDAEAHRLLSTSLWRQRVSTRVQRIIERVREALPSWVFAQTRSKPEQTAQCISGTIWQRWKLAPWYLSEG